jgi:hypothetical protein
MIRQVIQEGQNFLTIWENVRFPKIISLLVICYLLLTTSLKSLFVYRISVLWADRHCGLVVRVPGCRRRGPGSIPGATRFFWEVVGLERGPLSLVNAIEELLERKSSGSGLEIREYGRTDPSRWQRGTLYPQKLALTSPTSDIRSIGIVRSRTQTTESVLWAMAGKYRNSDICPVLSHAGFHHMLVLVLFGGFTSNM